MRRSVTACLAAALWLAGAAAALAPEVARDAFLHPATPTAVVVEDLAFLEAPPAARLSDAPFAVAGTAPRVEAVLYPIPAGLEGRNWSQWGDGVIARDGRFYSAIGDHGGPDGRSYLYAYDPPTRRLTLAVDQQQVLGQQPGDWGFGKIHCRLEQLDDGHLYWATYWGQAPPLEWAQGGELYGMVVRADPASGQGEVLGVLRRPFVIPAAVADTRRGLLYALPCDRQWEGQGFSVFDLARGETIYFGHADQERSRRFAFVDERAGAAYFTVQPDPASPDLWLARYGAAANAVDLRAIPLPPGYGPVRAGTEKADPRGRFYGVCEGRVVRLDPESRTAEPLGPLWGTQDSGAASAYTTVLEVSPGGRYLYALPGAHGQAWRQGAPVVQFDLRTGDRKVLAFLAPVFAQRYGYRVGGSYCLELSADGSRLFIGTNGAVADPGDVGDDGAFGQPACMVLHIPEEERPDDRP